MHRDATGTIPRPHVDLDDTAEVLRPQAGSAFAPPVDDTGSLPRPRTQIRSVAVADEWALVRHGVEAQLRRSGLRIAASAPTFHDLGELLRRPSAPSVDLAIIGTLSDTTVVGAARRMSERGIPVIVLDERPSPRRVLELWAAGVHAVIGRSARQSELHDALQAVEVGGHYLGAGLIPGVLAAAEHLPSGPHGELTQRELDVLRELAAGSTNHEISLHLHISAQTVKTHLANIYDKLGVHRRAHAVRVALSLGLL